MGRWIEWLITEPLTGAEAESVAAAFESRIAPALKALAGRSVWKDTAPKPWSARLAGWAIRRANRRWAADPESFVAGPDGVRIAPQHTPCPALIPFSAGPGACRSVGFQDYAVLAALALVASESGKAALTSGDELEPDYVRAILADLEAASGYTFRHVDRFLAPLADSDTLDDEGEDGEDGPEEA